MLIIDELASCPSTAQAASCSSTPSPRGTSAGSIVVTTNLAFSEWPKVFADDEKLTTALLDRLADRATILATKGKSFRMRRRKSEADQPIDGRGAPPVAALPPAGDTPEAAASSRRTAKKR